jgi:hypothetical protein
MKPHAAQNPGDEVLTGILNSNDLIFGEETFHAKVDTVLPEHKMKDWGKKTRNGDDEPELCRRR